MATTLSTTGTPPDAFSSTIVDAFIKKRILEHGQSEYKFRDAASKDPLPAGNGTNIKFIRYKRLVLPGTLTEGVAPAADVLEVETITGQCVQRGQVVQISDVLELTMWHPVVRKAMEELAEGAARKDDQIIQNVLLGATNVFYSDNGSATGAGATAGRAGLTLAAGDKMATGMLQKAIAVLETGADGGVDGGAKPYSNGFFKGILHRKHELDLLNDTVWTAMANRQDKGALEKASIVKWNRVDFSTTNFGPEFTKEVINPTLTGDTGGTGSLYTAGVDINWGCTKTHKKRGFEEVIDVTDNDTQGGTEESLGGSNTGATIDLTAFVGTGYTINVYTADDVAGANAPKLLHEKLDPDVLTGTALTAVRISRADATARIQPTAPATGETVYTSYILGSDSYSVVDLDSLKTLTTKGASKSDPLDQVRTMGTKFFDTAMILNNAFLVRIEAVSSF